MLRKSDAAKLRVTVIIIHTVFRLLLLRKLYVYTLLRGQPGILPLWDIRVVTCLYGPK